MRATRTVSGGRGILMPDLWGRVTMPLATRRVTRPTTTADQGGTMTYAASIVLKEGAEEFGTTHLATLRDEAGEQTPPGMDAEEVTARALLLTALEFAGYLHRNAEPLFLHALREFMKYQEFACIGCQASMQVVRATLSASPPTEEQLATLTELPKGDQLDDRDIKERLLAALHAVEAGVPFDEAIASIGGRIIVTGMPVDEDEDEG